MSVAIDVGRSRGLLVATFSTYPPRACGIGTFSFDLRSALLGVPGIDGISPIVVVDEPSGRQRPEVVATVAHAVRGDYVRAARLLGRLEIDVVVLQHEFGIFGGLDGDYVLSFAEELTRPLVVTLHTVLSRPSPNQLRVLRALCGRAERVTVMTDTARRLLVEAGASEAPKIRVVPHGAPAELGGRRQQHAARRHSAEAAAAALGEGRPQQPFLLSTFGLLSAGKGLETAIKALPAIIASHPEVAYVIAGRTHPQVAREEGERYRRKLENLVSDLDLDDHVVFDDRFLSTDELANLLALTDVFLTPYRNREQISSGSLTFAIAAGCAAVSTPYWYAEDLLASGAGKIVPFNDARALAKAVCTFIEQPDLLAAARAEARQVGSRLAWPSVAAATAAVLREAATNAPTRTPFHPTVVPPSRTETASSRRDERTLPEVGRVA